VLPDQIAVTTRRCKIRDLPRSIKNPNLVERDYPAVPESKIDLPDWMDQ
jgi:hypothetical protein